MTDTDADTDTDSFAADGWFVVRETNHPDAWLACDRPIPVQD